MRIAAQQCATYDDPALVADNWVHMGFNVEQLLHISAQQWLGRFDPTKSDVIKDYIARAHAQGLHIIFYYGGHWLDEATVAAHPDWRSCRSDGSTMNHACLGNPGYLDWAEELAIASVNLGADGIFLDGAYIAANGCYCPVCQSEFKQMFGVDMLTRNDQEQRHRLTEFQMHVVDGYLSRLQEAIHTANPEAIFYVNMPGMNPLRTRGVEMRRHLVYQHLLGAEGGFVFHAPAYQIPQWRAGASAKLLESMSDGKPTITFCSADHKPWNLYHITGPEATYTYCETVANGSNVWYGLHTPWFKEAIQTPAMQAVARMNHFTARHEAYYTGTTSAARVALLFSHDTAEEYRYHVVPADFTATQKAEIAGVVGDFNRSWMGCYEALLRSHVQFDMIDTVVITDTPQLHERYDLIVLPTVACMSDALAQALERFVAAGGHIIASHDVGTFDEKGRRRETPALNHVLGIHTTGRPIAMKRFSYFSLNEDSSLTHGVTQRLLPAPEWAWENSSAGAEVLAWFHAPHTSQYIPLRAPLMPAITRNHYGKGSAVYIAGTWFESYMQDRIPDHRVVTANLVNLLSANILQVGDVPGSIEVICRQQIDDERLIVHLINLTGDMGRPVERTIPIDGPITLSFPKTRWSGRAFPRGAITAKALMAEQALHVQENDTTLEVTLSRLHDYEVVIIES